MDEIDVHKRLKKLSVHFEVKARVTVLKSLSLAKGAIMNHVEASAKEGNSMSFKGAAEFLKNSLNKRLEHYLNP